MSDFEKYAKESEKFVQLVKMEEHLQDTRQEILPTNNNSDVLVTLVFVRPELKMQLDALKLELREIKRNAKKKMIGPMMVMGGPPNEREEELEEEIANLEEEMSVLNVTAPLDTLSANQMLDVLIRAIQQEKKDVKQALAPLICKLGLVQ